MNALFAAIALALGFTTPDAPSTANHALTRPPGTITYTTGGPLLPPCPPHSTARHASPPSRFPHQPER